jgi:hypothetical protein
LNWYKNHFGELDHFEGVVGEFGPSYFDVKEAPHRIRDLNKDCRIIVSIRNPVDRVFSVFLHLVRNGVVPPDFETAIEKVPRIITKSHYKQHTQRWIDCFGLERMHFVFFDDIKHQPQQTLDQMCEFIGISSFPTKEIIDSPINASHLPRFAWIKQINLMRRIASRFLREHQGFKIISWGQRIRAFFPDWLSPRVPQEGYPVLSKDQRRYLYNLYAEDIDYLESLLNRSLNLTSHE